MYTIIQYSKICPGKFHPLFLPMWTVVPHLNIVGTCYLYINHIYSVLLGLKCGACVLVGQCLVVCEGSHYITALQKIVCSEDVKLSDSEVLHYNCWYTVYLLIYS